MQGEADAEGRGDQLTVIQGISKSKGPTCQTPLCVSVTFTLLQFGKQPKNSRQRYRPLSPKCTIPDNGLVFL